MAWRGGLQGERKRLTNISLSIYYWLIIGFLGFIGTLFAPLVMQRLAETLNSTSF